MGVVAAVAVVLVGVAVGLGAAVDPDDAAQEDAADAAEAVERSDAGDGEAATTLVAADDGEVIYYTDFSDGLGPEWDIYDSIGHAGWGLRRPSAVSVTTDPDAAGGSLLTITASMGTGEEAGQLVSGGLKLLVPRTYGRYTLRARVESDPWEVTSGAALLWPRSNDWPEGGEIDILETWANRITRTPVESNLHWLDPDADAPYDSSDDERTQDTHPGVDGTEWHTYVLEWRPDLISIAIDGGPPLVMSTDPIEIADWDMEPTMQLDAFDSPHRPGEQPRMEGSVRMYVDFIKIEP